MLDPADEVGLCPLRLAGSLDRVHGGQDAGEWIVHLVRQSGGQATELRQSLRRMQAGSDFIALAACFQRVVDGVQKAPEFRSGAGDDLVG